MTSVGTSSVDATTQRTCIRCTAPPQHTLLPGTAAGGAYHPAAQALQPCNAPGACAPPSVSATLRWMPPRLIGAASNRFWSSSCGPLQQVFMHATHDLHVRFCRAAMRGGGGVSPQRPHAPMFQVESGRAGRTGLCSLRWPSLPHRWPNRAPRRGKRKGKRVQRVCARCKGIGGHDWVCEGACGRALSPRSP